MFVWSLWILLALLISSGFVLLWSRSPGPVFAALTVFLASVAGVFLVFGNVFLLTVYMIVAATVLFIGYAFFAPGKTGFKIMLFGKLKYFEYILFILFVINLFFVFLTIVLAGKGELHQLSIGSVSGWVDGKKISDSVFLPMTLVVTAFLISGLGTIILSRKEK